MMLRSLQPDNPDILSSMKILLLIAVDNLFDIVFKSSDTFKIEPERKADVDEMSVVKVDDVSPNAPYISS